MRTTSTTMATYIQTRPGRPSQRFTRAEATSGSGWVGTHGEVANVDQCPGGDSDPWCRKSSPSRRCHHESGSFSGPDARSATQATLTPNRTYGAPRTSRSLHEAMPGSCQQCPTGEAE